MLLWEKYHSDLALDKESVYDLVVCPNGAHEMEVRRRAVRAFSSPNTLKVPQPTF